MFKITQTFDQIYSYQFKNICYTDTGFHIWPRFERISKFCSVMICWKTKQIGMLGRIIFVGYSSIQQFECCYFTPFQFFEKRNFVEEETIEVMCKIHGEIFVTDKFKKIHQVVRLQLIGKCLIGAMNFE